MTSPTSRRRHSPAVYRRRRLVLLIALIAVVATIWLLIAQPWSGAATESGSPETQKTQDAAAALPVPSSGGTEATGEATPAADDEEADAAAAPSESATPTVRACLESDVTVVPVTDQPTYTPDQNPKLSIRLTNDGEEDCSLNVGTSAQKFEVTSGSDTWWLSTDCQSEPSDMVVMLTAGQTVESASPIEWDRTRSAVSTCDDDTRPRAPGGGATYHLAVEIGGIASTDTALFMLY